jgi:hypothetical protein
MSFRARFVSLPTHLGCACFYCAFCRSLGAVIDAIRYDVSVGLAKTKWLSIQISQTEIHHRTPKLFNSNIIRK